MQNKLRLSLLLCIALFAGMVGYAACSSDAPPSGQIVNSGTGTPTSTGTGSPTAGAGGGATTGTDGTTGTTTGSAGSGTGMGTGGAGTGTGTGTGGMGPDAGAACMSYTVPRANVLSPVDPAVAPLIQVMSVAEKLSIESGEGTNCGTATNYTCDFDSTGDAQRGIRPFPMRDGPRGLNTRTARSIGVASPSTTWAVAEARAASFDDALEYQVARVQAQEMRAETWDVSLAPVINTLRHPAWARAQETYGADPVLLGRMGSAFVNGLQAMPNGVIACPKHFVGNDTDNLRNSVIVTMDEQTLRENYARPFQMVVENSDPGCIMMAYNGVIVTGANNGGNWCTENPHLMTDILRTDWKWNGFVISDWWATKNNGVRSFTSGLDLEMPDNTSFVTVPAAVGTTVTAARVDEAATRILNARAKFGQLSPAYLNQPAVAPNIGAQASIDLARRTEEEGAVLLKNDGVLPLGAKATALGSGLATVANVLFLGPDAALPNTNANLANVASCLGDRGSSNNIPPHAVSFVQGFMAHPAAAAIRVTQSLNAADAAGKDVVIIPVCMAHEDEGEAFAGGRDRQNLTLTTIHPIHWPTKPTALINQVAMANPNAKIVVLLAVGAAVVMEDWYPRAQAIIQTFYPGQEGGTALAKLLFGDITFSGKLPFTVAQAEADYPAFQNAVNMATTDYFHDYRKIEQDGKTPRFWFGYGLSYNTYEYSDLQVLCPDGITTTGRLDVQVTVKNTGKMAGDEIVQLYIGYPNSTLRVPKKELKTYARVTLMPGESKQVLLSVPARDIAHWNMTTKAWVVETVGHTVLVGPSADPTKLLSANFTIH